MHAINNYLTDFTILDVILIFIYLIGVMIMSIRLKKNNNRFFFNFIVVGFMHLLMTFVYYFYTLNNVSDAVGYYKRVRFVFDNWGETFGQGANTIYFILYPIINFFQITYFGSFFIFSFFGLLGFYMLYKIAINISRNKFLSSFYIFLLPNAHFWSVGLGKDSLVFFAITYFVYNYYFRRSVIHYIVPCLLIGFIRIHILVFIVIALVLAQMFFNKKLKFSIKLFVSALVVISIGFLYPIIMERVGAKNGESISEHFENLEQISAEGGSTLDMQGKSLLVKLPSYLFRPALFEVKSGLTLIAAIENLVLLYIFYIIFKNRKIIKKSNNNYFYWYCIISIFIIITPSAMILYNLGIAMRQKYMVYPFIVIAYTIVFMERKKIYLVK